MAIEAETLKSKIQYHTQQLLDSAKDFVVAQQHTNELGIVFAQITDISTAFLMNEWKSEHLDTGVAISPVQAAKCLDESLRTQMFMQGVYACLKDKLAKQSHINVVYAGTGPYGLLLLPLLSQFSADAISVTLIDIHQENIVAVKKLIQALEVEPFINDVIEADATKWQPKEPTVFDVIISETMNTLLQKEPQISIFKNLIRFLSPDGQLIPEQVTLGCRLQALKMSGAPLIRLPHFFKLNKETCRQFVQQNTAEFSGEIPLPKEFSSLYYQTVQMTTDIQVYKTLELSENECSLNSNISYHNLRLQTSGSIKYNYVIDENPRFEFSFPEPVFHATELESIPADKYELQGLQHFFSKARSAVETGGVFQLDATDYQTFRQLHDNMNLDYGESLRFIYQFKPAFDEFLGWIDVRKSVKPAN